MLPLSIPPSDIAHNGTSSTSRSLSLLPHISLFLLIVRQNAWNAIKIRPISNGTPLLPSPLHKTRTGGGGTLSHVSELCSKDFPYTGPLLRLFRIQEVFKLDRSAIPVALSINKYWGYTLITWVKVWNILSYGVACIWDEWRGGGKGKRMQW